MSLSLSLFLPAARVRSLFLSLSPIFLLLYTTSLSISLGYLDRRFRCVAWAASSLRLMPS
jgi:hypothetical protein